MKTKRVNITLAPFTAFCYIYNNYVWMVIIQEDSFSRRFDSLGTMDKPNILEKHIIEREIIYQILN